MVTGWAGEQRGRDHQPAGRRDPGSRDRARHRRPRASAAGPAGPRRPRRPVSTRPASCRTWCTCTTQRPAPERSIVGAELVSWSAALTLREAGCDTVADDQRPREARVLRRVLVAGRFALDVAVATRTRVIRVIGQRPRRERSRSRTSTPARGARRLRHRRLHRRLDSRQRTRPRRGTRDRPGRRSARSSTPAWRPRARRVRGRQPQPSRRHRRRGRARRPRVADHVLAYLRNPPAVLTGNAARGSCPAHRLKWITPGTLRPDVTAPRNRLLAWPTTQTEPADHLRSPKTATDRSPTPPVAGLTRPCIWIPDLAPQHDRPRRGAIRVDLD